MDNYNFIEKILHKLFLSNKFINKSLFELEKILYLKNNHNIKNNSHIFISGMPRSGTTSILNFIYATNEFASLKYSNMPYILSPNFSKLLNQKRIPLKERLHSDGIFFNLDSPEAFDEFFFDNKIKFIKSELKNYVQLITLSENKEKYLSKNNLNYKRINLIQKIFPNSIFIIPIREPMQHAYSLFNQNKHFSNLHTKNKFIRQYMSYLKHNEFGLDHIPWNNSEIYHNSNDFNYWLEQWILFYENIFMNFKTYKNCFFVKYENLTNKIYLEKIIKKINLVNKNINFNFFINSNKSIVNISFDKNMYKKALEIYNKFD